MSRIDQILDVAETRMRASGYHAVSYRDIAADVGLRSASLHHHFPKKADLGHALVDRYAARFFDSLEHRTAALSGKAAVKEMIALYRDALGSTPRVCLCVMLGSEGPGLPTKVNATVKAFIDRNLRWIESQYVLSLTPRPDMTARQTLATLQGGMILSSVTGDVADFDAATSAILS